MIIEQRKIVDDWNRVHNAWTIIRKGKVRKLDFHLNLYSGGELSAVLKRAGFTDVKLYGDFKGAPYGPNANRLIAMARKAGSNRKRTGAIPPGVR
jgi:hypothetical protein